MIGASIEVNTVQFEAAMQRLQKGVRSGFIDPTYGLLPTQARLLAERCQTFTPPIRQKGRGVFDKSFTPWAIGKAAVARDLTVIYKPLSETTFKSPRLKTIVETDNRTAYNKASLNFRSNNKNLKNTVAMGFNKAWHSRNRMSRGRGRRGKNANLGYVTLGAEAVKAREYIAEKKKMVGWARAGWNQGIIGFGGKVEAGWVSRHGLGQGSFVNGTSSPDPFVQVTNSTSWAKYSGGEGNRILRNAIVARSRDMEAYFYRMMRLAATKAQAA